MKTLRINVIHLMLCLRWWLKYLSSFLLSIYVFRLKVKLESFQLIIHDVPCEDGKRLACQSRTPIPSRAPFQGFGWSSRCRWGSCCSSGSWSSKRASKTQSMFHQQDRQIFSSAFHPPMRRKYKRFPDKSDVNVQTWGPKAKLLTKIMLEDKIVEWWSGLRKSPSYNLYSEYLLPYLALPMSNYFTKASWSKLNYHAIHFLKSESMVTAMSEGILPFSIPTHSWHSVNAATCTR